MDVTIEVTNVTIDTEVNIASVEVVVTTGTEIQAPEVHNDLLERDAQNAHPASSISYGDLTVEEALDSVPTKTSDLTNDSDFVSDPNYVHTDNNYDDLAVQEVSKIADKQDATDDNLETNSNTIVGAINEVNSIAKGANQALSFDDYQAVIAAMLVSGLNAGQNLYVDTLDVPDLWVKVVEVASVPYTYVSDEQFITDILAGTQIGYYRLALLETQKVDLTNYYTKDETDQAIEDYASPLGHNHSGEDITPESVTTDQIVLNGFDRLGNPITVNLVYNTDLGVVEFQYPDGTVGQDHLELWFVAKCQGACRNGYGAQFVSSQGGHIVVKEMVASELNTQPQLFMGIFTQTAANGEFIKITWFGSVNDVSTTAYEAEGGAKILYVDMEGSGLRGFTTIVPNAPYRKIMAASIQKYSTGGSENGVILVRPTFGTKSQNLDDWNGSTSAFDTGNTIPIRGADGVIREINKSDFYAVLDDYFGALGNANTWALLQTFTSGLKTTKIIPNSDTTGVVIRNAADGADVAYFDTTNKRLGIGTSTPTRIIDLVSNTNTIIQITTTSSGAGAGVSMSSGTKSWSYSFQDNFLNGSLLFQLGVGATVVSLLTRTGWQRFGVTGFDLPESAVDNFGTTTFRDWVYLNTTTAHSGDAIGDRRTNNVSGVVTTERFTGTNATKGSGTKVVESKVLADGSHQFGDDTNNVTILPNGTIKLNGTATVFDDKTFDALALVQTGAGISLNNAECTVAYLTTANNADYMIAAPQFSHARKNGAVIFPHIHFEQAQNAVPNFALQYRWQINGGAKTTAWTAVKCNTLAFPYVSGTLNQIAYVAGGITPPVGDGISDICQFRIIRDTTNALGLAFGADPYTATVQVQSFDVHVELDQLGGSNEEYVK